MRPVLVIGSSNTDMVLRVPELPAAGQTILGDAFKIFAGGKGANQAVAARRAGGDVRFLAALGDDDFARNALDLYRAEGIDTSLVQQIAGAASGVAMIFVAQNGENSIGVAPGANAGLSAEMVRRHENAIADASVLLLQLESPLQAVGEAIRIAARHAVRTVLNPAPAAPLPDELLAAVYCITPNATEAGMLTGVSVADRQSAAAAAEQLLQRGVENVVITLGAEGALLCNADGCHIQQAPVVEALDTTAAGDTFNGVLATLLAEGQTIREAVGLAVQAASLSVQTAGAIASIPRREAFDLN